MTMASMRSATSVRALFVLGVLLLAGCATRQPPPTLYLLDTQVPAQLPGLEQGVIVGLGPIQTSRYLDRNQIVTRSDTPKLEASGEHQWAEPLKAGITRVMMVNLGLALDSNRIYELPMRRRRALDYQVPLDVLRFDGVLGREVVLSVRWTLLSGDGKEILMSQVSRITEPAVGMSVEDFVAAQSRALAELASEIADAIKRQAGSE
jgi:hypothetical protein